MDKHTSEHQRNENNTEHMRDDKFTEHPSGNQNPPYNENYGAPSDRERYERSEYERNRYQKKLWYNHGWVWLIVAEWSDFSD